MRKHFLLALKFVAQLLLARYLGASECFRASQLK
jgi:hypothetical protein